jgi:VanZ family protein
MNKKVTIGIVSFLVILYFTISQLGATQSYAAAVEAVIQFMVVWFLGNFFGQEK